MSYQGQHHVVSLLSMTFQPRAEVQHLGWTEKRLSPASSSKYECCAASQCEQTPTSSMLGAVTKRLPSQTGIGTGTAAVPGTTSGISAPWQLFSASPGAQTWSWCRSAYAAGAELGAGLGAGLAAASQPPGRWQPPRWVRHQEWWRAGASAPGSSSAWMSEMLTSNLGRQFDGILQLHSRSRLRRRIDNDPWGCGHRGSIGAAGNPVIKIQTCRCGTVTATWRVLTSTPHSC